MAFKDDPKPAERVETRGHISRLPCTGGNSGSAVLKISQPLDGFVGSTQQGDQCLDWFFSFFGDGRRRFDRRTPKVTHLMVEVSLHQATYFCHPANYERRPAQGKGGWGGASPVDRDLLAPRVTAGTTDGKQASEYDARTG